MIWILLFGAQICMLHSLPLNTMDKTLEHDPLTTGQLSSPKYSSSSVKADELITSPLHSAKDVVNQPENTKLRDIAQSYVYIPAETPNSNSPKSDRQYVEAIPQDPLPMPSDIAFSLPGQPAGRPPFIRPRPPTHPPIIPTDVEIIDSGTAPPYPPKPIPTGGTNNPSQFPASEPDAELIPGFKTGSLVSYRNKGEPTGIKDERKSDYSEIFKKSSGTNDSTIQLYHAEDNSSASLKVSHDKSGKSKVCITSSDEGVYDICFHFGKPEGNLDAKNESQTPSFQNLTEITENEVADGRLNENLTVSKVSATNSKPSTEKNTVKFAKLDWEIKGAEFEKLVSEKSGPNETVEIKSSSTAAVVTSTPAATENITTSVIPRNVTLNVEQNSFPNDTSTTHYEPKKTDNEKGDPIIKNSTKSQQTDKVHGAEDRVVNARSNDEREDDLEEERSADMGRAIENLDATPVISTTERHADLGDSKKKSETEEEVKPTEINLEDSSYMRKVLSDVIKNMLREMNYLKPNLPSDYVQNPVYYPTPNDDQTLEDYQIPFAREVLASPNDYDENSMETVLEEKMASIGEDDYAEEFSKPIYLVSYV